MQPNYVLLTHPRAGANRHEMILRRLSLALVILTMSSLAPHPARAAAGDLDSRFGKAGVVQTDFTGGDDYGFAVKVQADGKIVVAGQSGVYPLFHSALTRYNKNGALDRSFGTGGKVVAALDAGGDGLTAIAFQTDGKIVVAGSVIHDNFTVAFVTARFNADGSLDQTFANSGSVETTFGDSAAEGNDLVVQTDGKIVVVGLTGPGTYTDLNDFALVRFNSDGSLDPGFGAGGKLTTAFNTGSRATSAALQPDGKLVVGGTYETTQNGFALARYNSDGTLDATFGNFGKVTTPVGTGDAFSFGIGLLPDGRIVLGGYSSTSQAHDFTAACYNPDGTLDQSFGIGGVTATDFSGATDDIAYAVAVQRDGQIILGGRTGQYPDFNFALARYSSTGQLDQSFGSGGKVITPIASTADGYAVTVQRDGNTLLAGAVAASQSPFNFGLARYLGR